MRAMLYLVGFLVLSVSAMGARCLENVTVEKDAQGYTHIRGEMYNDTNIQGRFMILRARLLGPDGNVIAEKDSGLCPPALAPNGHSVFDIRFDQPNLPQHATYDIRTVTGLALDQHLPNPNIAVTASNAKRDGTSVVVRIDVKNNSGKEYFGLEGCGAAYDASGKVIRVRQSEFQNKNEQGTPIAGGLGPQPDYFLIRIEDVPAGATHARGWVYIEEPIGDQGYQPLMTNLLPITP